MSFSDAFEAMNRNDIFTEEMIEAEAQDLANRVRDNGAPIAQAELELEQHNPGLAARVRARATDILAGQ
ncbi:hypothetical protein [Herbiconiux sp.]|uniref:hypothetical protein n=1 Tax=Herbiconiux sp. TaxID=1871186 RepID=UPI0025C1D690|nr:hypothetical protein [Herbiconiux sp.]